jgi:MoaA/NifB/PqqE/SkfB family radical SAM enzyme
MGDILSVADWNKIIKELAASGTKAVIVTGGEPLLYQGLENICLCAKEQGLRVILSTNGILLPTVGQAILPTLDEVGIPIDGSWSKSNNKLRPSPLNEDHFSKAIEAIEYVMVNWPNLKLTIRTVITSQNLSDVIKIGYRLMDLPVRSFRWKLYQFVPRGYGAHTADNFAINTSTFKDVVQRIMTLVPELMVDSLNHDNIDGRYFLIEPDGEAVVPLGTHRTHRIGNVKKDYEGVLSRLNLLISDCRNRQRGYAGYHSNIADTMY